MGGERGEGGEGRGGTEGEWREGRRREGRWEGREGEGREGGMKLYNIFQNCLWNILSRKIATPTSLHNDSGGLSNA